MYMFPSLNKFHILCSCTNTNIMRMLAMYIYYASKKKEMYTWKNIMHNYKNNNSTSHVIVLHVIVVNTLLCSIIFHNIVFNIVHSKKALIVNVHVM